MDLLASISRLLCNLSFSFESNMHLIHLLSTKRRTAFHVANSTDIPKPFLLWSEEPPIATLLNGLFFGLAAGSLLVDFGLLFL